MPKKNSVADRHSKFKIGGHLYTIARDEKLISRAGLWGKCNHIDRVLNVDATISTRDYLCVLTHEFLEAVKTNRDFEISHHLLTNIEDSVFAMMVDNKDLVVDALTHIDE